jgi:hypothetical protein
VDVRGPGWMVELRRDLEKQTDMGRLMEGWTAWASQTMVALGAAWCRSCHRDLASLMIGRKAGQLHVV